MTKYLKYLTNYVFIGAMGLGCILGGHWLWLGFVFAVIGSVGGDFLLGEHGEAPEYSHPQIISWIMYSYLPAMVCLVLVFVWAMTPGDLFGIGGLVASATGYDALMAKASNSVVDDVGAALGLGLVFAMVNVIGGHELIHRTWSPVSLFVGRWFFAMSGGVPFETEHVYGHHHTLGQPYDASLSLRGDSYWAFLASAPFKQILYAWEVEGKRLARRGHSVYWIGNKLIRCVLRVCVVWAAVFLVGGWYAVCLYTVAFCMSKMMYEAIGYQFHHGQVCVAGEPYGDRHSWNCNRLMSQVVLWNVSKHSEHHEHPNRPFHELSKVKVGDKPLLETGCITNAFLAFFPPLFRRITGPQVLKWDEDWATGPERELAVQQNAQSDIPVYQSAVAITN